MSADKLIEEYQRLTRNCYHVDYGDKKAVKRNNDSVTRMCQIIETINNEFGAEGISKPKTLLDTADFRTDLWIATHLLEKVSLDKETEKKALSIIEKVAASYKITVINICPFIKVVQQSIITVRSVKG